MPFSNLFEALFFTAEAYLYLGYAPIPLYGDSDPSRPKVAAVPWLAYQKAKPSLDQCRDWFLDSQFAAIGVVTGTVSRLAVLDFDTPESFRDFEARFAALAQANVVKTRRGFHIYYGLPPNLRLSSRKGNGVDLLAEGSYVVARPTTIDGHAYKLIRGGQPILLGLDAIHQIQDFLNSRKPALVPSSEFRVPGQQLVVSESPSQFPAVSRQPSAVSSPSIPVQSPDRAGQYTYSDTALPSFTSELSAHSSLPPLYRYLVGKGEGRNQALFRASLTARDTGWTLEQTLAALVPAHANQKSPAAHPPESSAVRQREAVNTIRSVYSRPARPLKICIATDAGLPNTVRETLFQDKQTAVIRLWEGLRLKGIRPGQIFTAKTAVTLLKGVVGRDSIYLALNAIGGTNGERLFEMQSPSGHPLASNDAATKKTQETTNLMRIGGAQKPGINPKGRKTRFFVMPDPLEWCLKLGVKTAHSDPLTLDDLSSAKRTRKAGHRELIKRRPGTYPRRWLAHRLGVSLGSIDTYNDEIPLFYREQFIETRLHWSNLHIIPDDFTLDGVFLEDDAGKRYPARRPLAAKLLRQGKSLTYKRQDANYYWFGDEVPSSQFPVAREEKKSPKPVSQIEQQAAGAVGTRFIASGLTYQDTPVGTISIASAQYLPTMNQGSQAGRGVQLNAPTNHPTPKKRAIEGTKKDKPKREPSGRRRLKDEALENLAGWVYERVNCRSANPALHISITVARKLVCRYPRADIEKALRLLESRHNIVKPAGFFITVLRSEAKRAALDTC